MLAVQGLYLYEVRNDCTVDEVLQFDWLSEDERLGISEATFQFAQLMIRGTLEQLAEIDTTIESYLIRWDIDRLARVDLSILRLSIYALLFQQDIPEKVTIHEAVLLAQELSGDKAYSFINGILDTCVKDRRKRGAEHDSAEKRE